MQPAAPSPATTANAGERDHGEGISGYRVSVRLDNGTPRTFERNDVGGPCSGDRVRLDAGFFPSHLTTMACLARRL
jgi:hypothetical protein